jgi:hypothetical protein
MMMTGHAANGFFKKVIIIAVALDATACYHFLPSTVSKTKAKTEPMAKITISLKMILNEWQKQLDNDNDGRMYIFSSCTEVDEKSSNRRWIIHANIDHID